MGSSHFNAFDIEQMQAGQKKLSPSATGALFPPKKTEDDSHQDMMALEFSVKMKRPQFHILTLSNRAEKRRKTSNPTVTYRQQKLHHI